MVLIFKHKQKFHHIRSGVSKLVPGRSLSCRV